VGSAWDRLFAAIAGGDAIARWAAVVGGHADEAGRRPRRLLLSETEGIDALGASMLSGMVRSSLPLTGSRGTRGTRVTGGGADGSGSWSPAKTGVVERMASAPSASSRTRPVRHAHPGSWLGQQIRENRRLGKPGEPAAGQAGGAGRAGGDPAEPGEPAAGRTSGR